MPSDERRRSLSPARARIAGERRVEIDAGWEAAGCAPGACETPDAARGLDWIAAAVPGTVAGALREAGRWSPGEARDLDAEDWWFRVSFEAAPPADDEEVVLCLGGIATVHRVFLNGELLLEGDSMFNAAAVEVGSLLRPGPNELSIRCLALAPLLRERRRPRARWRTRLADNALRFRRTMLLGRCPGFAPGPAAVGPWRPVWLERRREIALEDVSLLPRCTGAGAALGVRLRLRTIGSAAPPTVARVVLGGSGEGEANLELRPGPDGELLASGEVRLARVERWWPHTHGPSPLYSVALELGGEAGETRADLGHVGFRDLEPGPGSDHDLLRDGLDLHLNGSRVFARGAVWTPLDPVALSVPPEQLEAALEQVRAAGMNMVRIPGTGAYEDRAFHDLCDRLGLLVWQDFAFANFDYPIADEDFRAAVVTEARQQLAELGGRPSLAVLCGNSEVEQQAAMLGLDPSLGRGELFGELLPGLAAELAPGTPYVPSSPCGGERPFSPDSGIANYYGVGGYRRPLTDARLSAVRFAGECLALANVPDEAGVEAVLPGAPADVVVHHPRWKAGVPRDAGTGWDFDDVRDHYLAELFGVDPAELRRYDHERYLELSRTVSGELMAAVFGEWRRTGSPCGGGLVLWLKDLVPGAGWGVVDASGTPKRAYEHLARALAPRAVWITDEGLGGLAVHVANDGPEPLRATLRVRLYADFEQLAGEASEELELDAHGAGSRDLESLLGGFVDASWAYRFGPPAQHAVVVGLEAGGELLSQAVHFPAGRPAAAEPAGRLAIEAAAERGTDGTVAVTLRCARLVWGPRLSARGMLPATGLACLEPGIEHRLTLAPAPGAEAADAVAVSAVNMNGRVTITIA